LAGFAFEDHVEEVGFGRHDGKAFVVCCQQRCDGFGCGVVGEQPGHVGEVVFGFVELSEGEFHVVHCLAALGHAGFDFFDFAFGDFEDAHGDVPVVHDVVHAGFLPVA
jgi:hypothetical protein